MPGPGQWCTLSDKQCTGLGIAAGLGNGPSTIHGAAALEHVLPHLRQEARRDPQYARPWVTDEPSQLHHLLLPLSDAQQEQDALTPITTTDTAG
jgi:hypothetical protein